MICKDSIFYSYSFDEFTIKQLYEYNISSHGMQVILKFILKFI